METKTIVQYVVAGVIVVGSLFVAYNAQDKITGQASEIKALQNQVAVLTDQAAQNEELINQNKALQMEVKNLETKLATKTKASAKAKASSKTKTKTNKKAHKAHKTSKKK
jgi:regulator of replication initiation timing